MNFRTTLSLVLLCLLSSSAGAESSDQPQISLQEAAAKIIEAARQDQGVWEKLAYLCDHIGHRLSGSSELEAAVEWAAEEMKRDGLENVHTQPVQVTHWVRGEESVEIVAPFYRTLPMLGLGGSVGTPDDGIEAPVLVVRNFDELEALGRERIEGRIVVYNAAWQGYGRTVAYRVRGASRAAQFGAVGALVRSVTPNSLRTPHTGTLIYSPGAPRIPAAAITVEDALQLQRLQDAGITPRLRLRMSARNLPPATSANVIAELKGRELPEEIIVIGGHIDSWDVGHGAQDDGVGVAVSMQAVRLLLDLGLRPRRTIRVVLFTDEERGGTGGHAYRAAVGPEVARHVAAIEMDSGAERPIGFGLGLVNGTDEEYNQALSRLSPVVPLLESIGAGAFRRGGGGADIAPIMEDGVPGFGLLTVGERYFDWHHTEADTLDKVNPDDLRRCLAAMTVLAYYLAEMPEEPRTRTSFNWSAESETSQPPGSIR